MRHKVNTAEGREVYKYAVKGMASVTEEIMAKGGTVDKFIGDAVMAFWGGMSVQKGALWWAGHHRDHHRYSDEPEDVHSPVRHGFWWSHMGWILSGPAKKPQHDKIKELADKHDSTPIKILTIILVDKNLEIVAQFYGNTDEVKLKFKGVTAKLPPEALVHEATGMSFSA